MEKISGDIVDVAVNLHRDLGPGLLESVYEMVMAAQLERRGYTVDRQKSVDIDYDGLQF